jgi:hypothetical protein
MKEAIVERDPIVEEVRRIREELAARHDFDVMRIMESARRREHTSGHKVVSHDPHDPRGPHVVHDPDLKP